MKKHRRAAFNTSYHSYINQVDSVILEKEKKKKKNVIMLWAAEELGKSYFEPSVHHDEMHV